MNKTISANNTMGLKSSGNEYIKAVVFGLIIPLLLHGFWMKHLVFKHYHADNLVDDLSEHPVIANIIVGEAFPSSSFVPNGRTSPIFSGDEKNNPKINDRKEQKEKVLVTNVGDKGEDQDQIMSSLLQSTAATHITPSGRPQSNAEREPNSHRAQYDQAIAQLRNQVDRIVSNAVSLDEQSTVMTFVQLGNHLIIRDRIFNGGGIDTYECVWAYKEALKRLMPIRHKSQNLDRLTCTVNSNMGEAWFMADMFENAVESFSEAINYPCDDESLSKVIYHRGNTYLILGKYEEAGRDFLDSIKANRRDVHYWRILEKTARILNANESAIPGGWPWFHKVLLDLLPEAKEMYFMASSQAEKDATARAVQLVLVSLFSYYDAKGNNVNLATIYLDESQNWKKKFTDFEVPDQALEAQYYQQVGRFTAEYFSQIEGLGNKSRVPIFGKCFDKNVT